MVRLVMKRFTGKIAIITGASSGIGQAVAKRLASEGAFVVLFARREELLKKCQIEIEAEGGNAICFVGDVTREDDVKGCIEKSLEHKNKIDILINNAGVELVKSLSMTSLDELDYIIDVNIKGIIRFIQKAQRYMTGIQNGASIVNVSSVSGMFGVAGLSAYSMTKGGVISITKSLAIELAPRKIRVNVIAAGIVETDLTQRMRSKLGSQQLEQILKMHPLGFGTPYDVASGIAFLASDEAKWITGSILVIDGGYTAS